MKAQDTANEEETRANIFASSFLMPEKDLIKVFEAQDTANDAETVAINLARIFAVHLLAIVYRLSEFELPMKQWLFLILKYMAHPARIIRSNKGPQPKIRVIRSATHETIHIPWNQGADSIGLSLGNLTLEQACNFRRHKSTERIMIKMLDENGAWRKAEAFCHATYKNASSPAAGPLILGFFTIKDIRLLG